jgi:2-dehydropantoate 2-reductase
MLGAGAVGGYFGVHLQEAGADVTFLVRPERAARLRDRGLRIYGACDEVRVKELQVIESGTPHDANFDAVIVSCKAYDLSSAIQAVRPYVGPDTVVLPLLNGLKHLDALDSAFGTRRVLGGLAHISTVLDGNGDIRQLTKTNVLIYGARDATQVAAVEALGRTLKLASFSAQLSNDIMQEMWEKFVVLAVVAGMSCLMRSTIGEIAATKDGAALTLQLLSDCAAIASAAGHAPRMSYMNWIRPGLTNTGSALDASMRRDLEQSRATEADYTIGDLLQRAKAVGIESPVLRAAYCQLQTYEQRRTKNN